MLGKGALIIVFAFVVAVSGYQVKLNNAVVATRDNFNQHYSRVVVHENSLSAMNLGINEVWANKTTNANFTVAARNCTSDVAISPLGTDSILLKVTSRTYVYDEDHIAKYGKPYQMLDSVIALFDAGMPISKYFWYTDDEKGVFWITGDTVWGPMHTNKTLKTKGKPVFYGKVTAFLGISPEPWKPASKAEFLGGWEIGMEVDMPTDMTPLLNAANAGNGAAPMNTKSLYDKEVEFDFQADGSVIRTVDGGPPDTTTVANIAPTGAIYGTDDIRVKGTFNGQLTIYTDKEIWIDDDIVYADNPLSNPNSDDILGLVAKNFINITDNAANNSGDVNIQATILAIDGSYQAENYNTRPPGNTIQLTGSVAQYHRGPVGTFNGSGTLMSGFYKNYRYDGRLNTIAAPHFPTIVDNLRLVEWWE
jgi:hypothetical protein